MRYFWRPRSASGLPSIGRHGRTGDSSAKSHKDVEGTGTSVIQGEAERVGIAKPEDEKAHGD